MVPTEALGGSLKGTMGASRVPRRARCSAVHGKEVARLRPTTAVATVKAAVCRRAKDGALWGSAEVGRDAASATERYGTKLTNTQKKPELLQPKP